MYALVRDYLTKNAYAQTLSAVDADYAGLHSAFGKPVAEQEETKQQYIEEHSLKMRRKMTIDFAEKLASDGK